MAVRILWYCFLAIWAAALLGYGGVAPSMVATTAGALGILNLVAGAVLREPLRLSRAAIVFGAILGGVFLVQMLPGMGFLFPVTAGWRERHGVGAFWPATADAFLTVRLAAQVACYGLSGLLVLRLRRAGLGTQEALRGVLALLGLEALYGCVQVFAGLGVPFWGPRATADAASGTLVGRNNFAGLMAVGFVLAAGFAYARFAWPPRRSEDEPRPRLPRKLESGLPWAMLAALFVVGLVLSKSRGGSLSAAAGLLLFPFLYRGRASVAGGVAVVLAAAVAVIASNPAGLFARFEQADDARVEYWVLSAQAALRQPVFGYGAGTHPHAFHPFQPPTMPGQIHHAHSEYATALFEGGFVFLGLLLWGLALWFGRVWRAQRTIPSTDRAFVTAILAAAAVVALHAVVDMDLRITSNGMLFGVLLGLGAAAARQGSDRGAWTAIPALAGIGLAAALAGLRLDTSRWVDPMVDGAAPLDEAGVRRALGLSPYDYRPAWMQARAAQSRGRLEEADGGFERAAELFPAHAAVQREAGLWFWSRHVVALTPRSRAEACLHRLFEQRPGEVEGVMKEVWDARRPLEDFEALIPAGARSGLAVFLVDRGLWQRGMEVFARSPKGVAAHDRFASALERAGQWGLEAQVREERLKLRSDGAGNLACAAAWRRLGLLDKALERAESAGRIDPASASPQALKAEIQQAQGERMAALESWAAAIQRAPREPNYWLRRAALRSELKMHVLAAEDYGDALRLRPGDRGWLLAQARELVSAGDRAGARSVLDRHLAAHPDDREALKLRDGLSP